MDIKLNKKIMSMVLAGVMTISTVFRNKASAETKTFIKANTKVNIRVSDSNDSKRIATLNEGDVLEAIQLLDNGWYEVLLNGNIAYVCGDYVSPFTREIIDNQKIVRATSNVRVRSEDNTESEKLTTLSPGDILEYVETMPSGWHKVRYKDSFGYICNDYAVIDTEGIHKEVVPVVIANDNLNVRNEPSKAGIISYVLKKDEKLQYIDVLNNGWVKVLLNGNVGYVSGDYVTPSMDEMITNKVYRIVSMNQDTTLYQDKEFSVPIGSIPKYEIGFVYNSAENYYLINSINGEGYIKKSNAKSLGDVAVVVDVSSQVVSLFKNGNYFHTGACVTGKDSTPTNIGLFKIRTKIPEYDMKKYGVHVAFWMPFNGDQGLHDASWRDSFGGEKYKKHGSHGCVNLSYDTAKIIYDNIEKGTKVLVKR